MLVVVEPSVFVRGTEAVSNKVRLDGAWVQDKSNRPHPRTEKDASATSGIPISTLAVNYVAQPMLVEAMIKSINM